MKAAERHLDMKGFKWEKVNDELQVQSRDSMSGCILTILILHWNARSLITNGQDFKQFILNRKTKPDTVCVQESWLKPVL